MSENPSSPLLGSTSRPASKHSRHSDESHEDTPLLSSSSDTPRYDGEEEYEGERASSLAATSLQNGHDSPKSTKGRRRWPTILAISTLGVVAIAIIVGAFFAPAVIEEYAKEALIIEPTNISIDSFLETGVRARIQANFRLDASRVKNKHIRGIGRFGTWIAHEIEVQPSTVEVYLPDRNYTLIGTAAVPSIVVNIRNGHTTAINFLTDLEPGSVEGIRQVANDWLEGRLNEMRVLGKADVGLKSGLISLGTQSISESLVFEGNNLPKIPQYNITRLNFKEVLIPSIGRRGMAAEVSLSLVNSYPVKLAVPPLGFDILVPNCGQDEPYIRLADAKTDTIHVEPNSEVAVDINGIVQHLPKPLLQTCPHSNTSPLDLLLGRYIHGNNTTVYVRGSSTPGENTPEWITQIISSVTVPVPFPGHAFDNVIKSFSLTDTHFSLPDPFADPESDEANPQISGNIVVLASIPKEMNFGLNVTRVRAQANVIYKGQKLGVLNLHKWQQAESEKVDPKDGEGAAIKIQSRINDAPLNVTDEDVFTDVLQSLFWGGSTVILKIEALVDVEVTTVLGKVVVKQMPATGVIPVKPISTGVGFSNLKPQVGDLRILSTGQTSLTLEAQVNFTNPTEYTAHVPFINIHILSNGSIIGDATAKNITVLRGNNTNLIAQATWDPTTFGGQKGHKIGRELLSQYISGFNTTLTFQTHEKSIPLQPRLGKALSKFEIEIPTPRLSAPGNDDDSNPNDDKPHFIDNAVFHLFSSTAVFTIVSPLQYSTIFIENINATAFYNHTEPIGIINYDLSFKVPPGRSNSPRLPVDWSFGSVGYEKIREALGGGLKLDAKGTVKVRLEHWAETIWYVGSGIGAKVQI